MSPLRLAALASLILLFPAFSGGALADDAAVQKAISRQDHLKLGGDDTTLLNEAKQAVKKSDTAANRYLLGRAYAMTGSLDKARDEFNWAVEKDPHFAYSYAGLGFYDLAKGDLAAAAKQLHHATQLDPKLTNAHVYLAQLYLQKDEHLAAEKEFLAVLDYDPGNLDVRLLLAEEYLHQGSFERATQELQAALSKNPDSERAQRDYAFALAGAGRLDAAIAQFQKVLADEPKDLDSYSALEQLQLEKGDTKGAIATIQKLIGILPKKSPYIERLKDEIARIKKGRSMTFPMLLDQLESKDVEKRRKAMRILSTTDIQPIPKKMLDAVDDKDAEVRVMAVKYLAKHPVVWFVDICELLLVNPKTRDSSPRVRAAAAWVLATMKDPLSFPILLAALGDKDIHVFRRAVDGLRAMSGEFYVDDPSRPIGPSQRKEVAAKWRAYWRGPESYSLKLHSIARLEKFGQKRLARYLLPLIADDDLDVATHALQAFQSLTGSSIGTAKEMKTKKGRLAVALKAKAFVEKAN